MSVAKPCYQLKLDGHVAQAADSRCCARDVGQQCTWAGQRHATQTENAMLNTGFNETWRKCGWPGLSLCRSITHCCAVAGLITENFERLTFIAGQAEPSISIKHGSSSKFTSLCPSLANCEVNKLPL